MLKKPRKYEKKVDLDEAAKKKRVKSPGKVQFDDMLIYGEGYDRNNLHSEELAQAMMFFTLRQRILLVQHEGQYCEKLKEKYRSGYQFYRKAMETMKSNKNTKQFALDPAKVKEMEIEVR